MLLTINVILVSFATLWAVNGVTVPPHRIYYYLLKSLHDADAPGANKHHHMGLARAMAARKGEIRVTYTAPDQYESNAAIPSYPNYCNVYYEHHRDKCPQHRTLDSCQSYCPEERGGSLPPFSRGGRGRGAAPPSDSQEAQHAMDTDGDGPPPSSHSSQWASTQGDEFPEAPQPFSYVQEACLDFRTAIDGVRTADLSDSVRQSLYEVIEPFALAIGVESFVIEGRKVTVTRAVGTHFEELPPQGASISAPPAPPATSELPQPTGTTGIRPTVAANPLTIRINKRKLLGRPPPPPPGTKASALVLRFRPSPTGGPVIPPLPAVQNILAGISPPPVHVGYTLRGDLLVRFSQAIGPELKKEVVSLLSTLHAGGVELLSRDTTSLIKFMHVPTRCLDGAPATADYLHSVIAAHPRWKGVFFVQKAHFVVPTGKTIGFTATVVVEVADDRASSVARRLLQSDVVFDGVPCRARPWVLRKASRQCGICLRWGHTAHVCSSRLACSAVHSQAVHQDPSTDRIKFDEQALARLQADRLKRVRQARSRHTEKKVNAKFAARYNDLD
ncbi:hypothetical protein F5887DRAFT_927103 [Amanita rubescens]|nr:hypothetical protein F5887DRAFT_927103 [Amanita rubescens]